MKLSDEKRIDAPRAQVWDGLNDPEILRASIPGCENLTQISDTVFEAEVRAKVGPVKAKFKSHVELSDLNPPESYRISGEGKGGAAGFAKGGATVTLAEDGEATILSYDVDADVGGKLAQIGNRLVEGTAKKMAAEFFDNFEAALKGEATGAAAEPAPAGDTAEAPAEAGTQARDAETPPPAPGPEARVEPARAVPQKGAAGKVWVIVGIVFVVGALVLTLLQ